MVIPDVEILLDLEPEELAARVSLVLKQISNPRDNQGMLHRQQLRQVAERLAGDRPFPKERSDQVAEALAEAWALLENQGFLVPAAGINGNNGYRVLSRRAKKFEGMQDFVPHQIARRLDADMLNLRIRAEVWAAFIRGHFEVAAGVALKAVEVAIRESAGYGNEKYGKVMAAEAFNPDNGPLTDNDAPKAEKEAMRDLFCGAIGTHKNPHSHRKVNLDDATEALEVVMLANHLLRIVDRCAARIAASGGEEAASDAT